MLSKINWVEGQTQYGGKRNTQWAEMKGLETQSQII